MMVFRDMSSRFKLTAVEDSYELLFRYYPVDCDNVVTYVQYKKYDCAHVQECNVQKSCLLSPKGIGGNKFCQKFEVRPYLNDHQYKRPKLQPEMRVLSLFLKFILSQFIGINTSREFSAKESENNKYRH